MRTQSNAISRFALCSAELCSTLAACSPFPDEGEFLAGVVFSGNFIAGVKSLRTLPATGRHRGTGMPLPYTLLMSSGSSAAAVSTAMPASSPLWTDAGKRDPLAVQAAQPVYVFDNERNCTRPAGAPPYDWRWDLIDPGRQYPIFSDLPEVLTGMNGRAGRGGAYSAIVEIVRIQTPPGFPCQSIKRADTVRSRLEADLRPAAGPKEYRLLLIVDAGITIPPLPYQLGWFDQLVVPYIDMGPVPLDASGQRFATMPVYNLVPMGAMNPVLRVVVGSIEEQGGSGPAYSPICRDHTLTIPNAMAIPPTDVTDPAYQAAMPTPTLSACLVCYTLGEGVYQCPLATSRAGAR